MFKINKGDAPEAILEMCRLRSTDITLEVLPVTNFLLTLLISVSGRQPSIILDQNNKTVYLGQSNSLNHLKVLGIISKIILC